MGGYDPFLRSSKAIYSGKTLPWTLGYVTEFWDGLTGITVTGQGVSTWVPVKGTHNFTQGTDGARPTYSNGVLTFNGSDEQIVTGAFDINQPCTVGIVFQQITFTNGDVIWRGLSNAVFLRQLDPTPQIELVQTTTVPTSALAVGAFGSVISVANGAASSVKVNALAAVTGTIAAGDPDGFSLGANAGASAFSNIAVKAFWYANTALTDSQQAQMARSLMQRYSIA